MTDSSIPLEVKPPKRRKGLIMLLVGCLIAAAAGGGTQLSFASTGDPSAPVLVETPHKELSLGRIVVNVRADGGNISHLILEPVIAYEDMGETTANIEGMKLRFRDSFIDYLSQVSVQEVSGSAGLANVRSELMRRARVVANSDAPKAILIQEYILQ